MSETFAGSLDFVGDSGAFGTSREYPRESLDDPKRSDTDDRCAMSQAPIGRQESTINQLQVWTQMLPAIV